MRKLKCLTAGALVLLMCLTACAESGLTAFVDAAEKLAFDTGNVTISGQAEFLLDGERFKTARIAYAHDGENSFWQEKLETPREGKPDLESGFTVIQNRHDLYVMEDLQPGVCRTGSDSPQRTLLRRSPLADLLLAMAKTAAAQPELFFGDSVSVTETADGGRELRYSQDGSGASSLLDQLAMLGMQFAGKRLLGVDPDDRTDWYYPLALTPVRQILHETKALALGACDVTVRLDAEGRLEAASGTVTARLTGYDEETLEDSVWTDRTLEIRFALSFSAYGETSVSAFDAETYGVIVHPPFPAENPD